MKQKKKSKKTFGVPAYIPDEKQGWDKALAEKMREHIQSGKGSKPRPVNKAMLNANWDEIDWGKK